MGNRERTQNAAQCQRERLQTVQEIMKRWKRMKAYTDANGGLRGVKGQSCKSFIKRKKFCQLQIQPGILCLFMVDGGQKINATNQTDNPGPVRSTVFCTLTALRMERVLQSGLVLCYLSLWTEIKLWICVFYISVHCLSSLCQGATPSITYYAFVLQPQMSPRGLHTSNLLGTKNTHSP